VANKTGARKRGGDGTTRCQAKSTQQWSDDVRNRIKVSYLMNRLHDFAMGKEGVELDARRIKAIEILLKKSLPDLQSVVIQGDKESPIQIIISAKDSQV
jgi:hypothetical protein